MEKIKRLAFILLFFHTALVANSQIVADHTVVDRYDDIPQYWIDEVKKMLVNIGGESHSMGYQNGVNLLESFNSLYSVSTYTSYPPPAETSSYLRLGRPWMVGEDIWTSQSGITNLTGQLADQNDNGNPYDVFAFGWCWDMHWINDPGGTEDPVHRVRWAGSSEGGPDGNRRWGLDSGDEALTGNAVCMDTYLSAIEQYNSYCEANNIPTRCIFTTGPVDDEEQPIGGTENGYQRELKQDHIRAYVAAGESRILFDYADILCWNDAGEKNTVNWDDDGEIRPHAHIHPDNMMDYDNSWNIIPSSDSDGDHIGEVGALRLGKAMWWLLARIAGWDGNVPAEPIEQNIILNSGWNILSFAVEPEDPSLMSILQPLISEGSFFKLQDERGFAIQHLREPAGWVNSIGNMSVSEGYKINLSSSTTLNLTGLPVLLPFDIQLEQGWNIMGFPALLPGDASMVFGPLISAGVLEKVQNELGESVEYIEGEWMYGFTNLYPGEGYRVKLYSNAILEVTGGSKGSSLTERLSGNKPVHFKTSDTGNGLDHMNIYIGMGEWESHLRQGYGGQRNGRMGDEIGVFDGDLCVGAAVIEGSEGKYITVAASFDDPVTGEKDGFEEGNRLEIRIWSRSDGSEVILNEVEPANGYGMTFERQGTTVLKAKIPGEAVSWLGDAYPNPSRDKTTFTFGLAGESRVRLEIIDIVGNTVEIILDETMPGGTHRVEWDNLAASGGKVRSGMYLIKLAVNEFVEINQFLVL